MIKQYKLVQFTDLTSITYEDRSVIYNLFATLNLYHIDHNKYRRVLDIPLKDEYPNYIFDFITSIDTPFKDVKKFIEGNFPITMEQLLISLKLQGIFTGVVDFYLMDSGLSIEDIEVLNLESDRIQQ
ncbi:hypothetical protein GJU40_11690 [Bacillus lacus]|uniref:Uncharacterized protein n=1 Tax=Metabacillus lacus TaxID=1983721 RepID=A0A7X2J133_9BACI|nr:hypothetical protein [Metabacillus lacus]MRX72808.1 hypothetical protein [Metabacillus lacus]